VTKVIVRAVSVFAIAVALASGSALLAGQAADSKADELNKKGDGFYKSGKFKEAIEAYTEALKADANNDHAIGYIAYSHNKMGDTRSARDWLKKRVELPGQTPSRKASTLTEIALLYWDQAHLLLVSQMASSSAMVGQTPDAAVLLKTEGGVTAAKLLIEGIDSGQRAVAIAPRSAKAFNLLNLMYRATAALERDAAKKTELIAKADEALRQSVQFFEALKEPPASDLFLTPTLSTINGREMGATVKLGTAKKKELPEDVKADGLAVEVVVGMDGKVRLPRVIAGRGKGGEAAALAAIRQWEFEPSTFEGRPIQVIQVITLPVK
jgi:tetratricopeptide (TPR) repeat protein